MSSGLEMFSSVQRPINLHCVRFNGITLEEVLHVVTEAAECKTLT